jgi:hypothetical protein
VPFSWLTPQGEIQRSFPAQLGVYRPSASVFFRCTLDLEMKLIGSRYGNEEARPVDELDRAA